MNPVLSIPLASLLLMACPSKTDPTSSGDAAGQQAGSTGSRVNEKTTAEGDVIVEVDLDADDQPDVYNYYDIVGEENTRVLLRKEVDLNRDGRIDVWTFFTKTGEVEREEMDSDFDGSVDWIDHYQGGKRVKTDVDTSHDGQFDLFKYYEAGRIKNRERDTNGDGRVDYWEYFDAEGKVAKVGWDIDNDGQMDVREE